MGGLRDWQQRFLDKYQLAIQNGQIDFLLVATPGSGKTLPSLVATKNLLDLGLIQRVVVVVPTEHLKDQWARTAHKKVGLELLPKWTGERGEGKDFCGVVVTYQSLATQAEMHRLLCSLKRTLVIFDEDHHLGDVNAWGEAAQLGFGGAAFRLSLSGTPFRTDGIPIPFVKYAEIDDEAGRCCVADFSYSYLEACRDKVVREVCFPSLDGNCSWEGRYGEHRATVSEVLTPDLDRERMWTVLDPDSKYMRDQCTRGNAKLSECRETGHHNAGGLVLAPSIKHAERLQELMSTLSGERAMLVVSDHEEATTIDAFRESSCRWLIAVRMLTEGVDIDRLRVLIYATYILTELFFRQSVGRVIRRVPELKTQPAYVLIPDHPVLHKFAASMEAEVAHALAEEETSSKARTGSTGATGGTSTFRPIYAEGVDAGVIVGDGVLSPSEIEEARKLKRRSAISDIHEEDIARILRASRTPETEAPDLGEKTEPTKPTYVEQEELRRECNTKAYRRDILLGVENGSTHVEWLKRGGKPQGEADVEELRRKRDWLLAELERLKYDHVER